MSGEVNAIVDGLGDDSEVWNEFAEIKVSIDHHGLTPRLLLQNVETGHRTFLDPLELAAFIDTPDELRVQWLRVGAFRDS